jgi:hypothetical protein
MVIMEQALYVSKVENLKYVSNDFTRLYFGQEFCERLIPAKEQLEEVLSFVEKENLEFTFVTPYVTESGLDRLEDCIGFLAERRPDAEVVFNDWGIFQFLRESWPGLTPVMGRLLNKQKRGPRIINIIDKVPSETRDFYQGSNLDVPAVCRFLKSRGISRVEFDNLLRGINLEGADKEIHKSLYMPFAFVSTTRLCLSANCDSSEKSGYVGIGDCSRECQKYTFNLENPVMRLPLIRKGNAIFFLNEDIPDVVSNRKVDRIVIEPEIPI